LQDIEARRAELNYRQLILAAIKKHASGFDREYSWSRRSRRFGSKAPGTRNGDLPFLANYIDTSGSISIQEANDFLEIIDNFLRVGSRKCQLNLWHTSLYYSERYRLGDRLDKSVFESGGTDLEDTMRHIQKHQPDLSIILTDGCYCDVDVESWLRPGEHFPQTLFIISRDGTEDHPFKDRSWANTVKIPNTDYYGHDKRLEEQ
jgi:predicted metal-dependent peptidase